MSEAASAGRRGRGTDSREMAPEVLPPSATFERIETNGIELHTLVAGDDDAPPAFLFHGFPEFWYGWRAQIGPLVDAGYRVIVPDQRGYNRSDKPAGVGAYAIDEMAADAVGLLDAFGCDRARVVGHDWGAGVVWQLLARHPERIDRAVAMNVPHPQVFEEFLPGRPSQLLKSWYIFFFQLPRIPEVAWRADDWRGLRWFIDTSNSPETFDERALDRYKRAWERPGAFTGMINWYRALVREDVPEPPTWTVEPETMLIWGMEDPYLHPEMAEASTEWCSNGRFEPIEDATHWVQHEADERVNDLLREFLE